jgi:putative lipoprotein
MKGHHHRRASRVPLLLAPLAAAAVLTASSPARADPPATDPWLGKDKALHFTLSAGIAGAGYGAASFLTTDLRLRLGIGAGLGILAGAGKELIDLTGAGDPSWKDFTWDVVGTFVGLGIAVSIDVAVRALRPRWVAP